MSANFKTKFVEWNDAQTELLAVRTEVFVIEQQVPEEMERDEHDPISKHVLAIDSETGIPIGTARLLPTQKIGRVAVLKSWRKHGVGAAMMRVLIDLARSDGMAELTLHGQTWTIGFYESCGFVAEGPEFDEAGIPHRKMRLVLS